MKEDNAQCKHPRFSVKEISEQDRRRKTQREYLLTCVKCGFARKHYGFLPRPCVAYA